MLEIKEIYSSYGSNLVLKGVSLRVTPGETAGLLGRNGVGKTTILRAVLGLSTVISGTVKFDGVNITRMPIHARTRLGISYVPDDKGIFASLTTYENLQVAQIGSKRSDIGWVMELFPILKERMRQVAGSLSGGEQQILSVARALIVQPKLLVLDEITEGLAPEIVAILFNALDRLKKEGKGILLAEQNVQVCLSASERIYVILGGGIVFSGTVSEARDYKVVDKYIKI